MDEQDRERELTRIGERIQVIGLWLTQGRCGDDDECLAAKTAELRALQRRRAALEAERADERRS